MYICNQAKIIFLKSYIYISIYVSSWINVLSFITTLPLCQAPASSLGGPHTLAPGHWEKIELGWGSTLLSSALTGYKLVVRCSLPSWGRSRTGQRACCPMDLVGCKNMELVSKGLWFPHLCSLGFTLRAHTGILVGRELAARWTLLVARTWSWCPRACGFLIFVALGFTLRAHTGILVGRELAARWTWLVARTWSWCPRACGFLIFVALGFTLRAHTGILVGA